jgi:hypothetical protein
MRYFSITHVVNQSRAPAGLVAPSWVIDDAPVNQPNKKRIYYYSQPLPATASQLFLTYNTSDPAGIFPEKTPIFLPSTMLLSFIVFVSLALLL